jgi:hypothetical protein
LKQQSFSSLEQAHKNKRTKREVFLAEMDAAVPWHRLKALIAPHYTKPRNGRPQMPLAVMLRIYFCNSGMACPILKISGPCVVAAVDWISPPKPRRDENALC